MKVSKISTDVFGNRKRLKINCTFTGVTGSLKHVGTSGGFKFLIDNCPAFSISSVKTNNNELIIYTTAGYNAINGIENCQIVYEPTGTEYICDGNGIKINSLPAIPLYEEGYYSPYCHCGYFTETSILTKKWESICSLDIPDSNSYKPFVCNHNVISPRILNNHRQNIENGITFFRFIFKNYTNSNLELLWGCSGKIKISIDGSDMVSHTCEKLTFASFIQKINWDEGLHTIDVAFTNTVVGRGDKGITLKLRSIGNDELPELIRDDNAKYYFNK